MNEEPTKVTTLPISEELRELNGLFTAIIGYVDLIVKKRQTGPRNVAAARLVTDWLNQIRSAANKGAEQVRLMQALVRKDTDENVENTDKRVNRRKR